MNVRLLRNSFCVAAVLFAIIRPAQAQDKDHIFPQFADGRLSDGTYYRSTLMVLPWFDTTVANCTLTLRGMTTTFDSGATGSSFSISIPAGGFSVSRTMGTQGFQGGYAELNCSDYVYANVLYTFYAPNGTKLAEATVFSSNETYSSRLILDQRDGARLAVAIANNTAAAHTYTITLNAGGATRSSTITIPARTTLGKFIDELVIVPSGSVGIVEIKASDFTDHHAVGLRFTGAAFTTIPTN